jgi:predicted CopG family antitoxin
MNHLQNIFKSFGISLYNLDKQRDLIDVLEDIYLKLSTEEFDKLIKKISMIESEVGHIFDEARNGPYK